MLFSQVVAFLEAQGYRPYFRTYRMGHQISPEVLEDLRRWLGTVLPPGGKGCTVFGH